MAAISVKPITEDLSFGARVGGITRANLADPEIATQLNALFEDRGVILFEGLEPAFDMQIAVSRIFGPLKGHSFKGVGTVEGDVPGVMELKGFPGESDVFVVDGRPLTGWTPWHFDACYDRTLNRAGVLRVVEGPPEGGMTGFIDGIQLYRDISPMLRDRFETIEILYHPALMYVNMRYARPRRLGLRHLSAQTNAMFEVNADRPRAIHPAIWQRPTGEKVLHVAPWQADGIAGQDDAAGDALLEEMFAEIAAKAIPYIHGWKPNEMIIWDNWRFLHCGTGHDPSHRRLVHRTTIEGDYGLGRLETDPPPTIAA